MDRIDYYGERWKRSFPSTEEIIDEYFIEPLRITLIKKKKLSRKINLKGWLRGRQNDLIRKSISDRTEKSDVGKNDETSIWVRVK